MDNNEFQSEVLQRLTRVETQLKYLATNGKWAMAKLWLVGLSLSVSALFSALGYLVFLK